MFENEIHVWENEVDIWYLKINSRIESAGCS